MLKKCFPILLLLLFGLAGPIGLRSKSVAKAAPAQEIPSVSPENYQQVLDIVFPRGLGDFSDLRRFNLVLRFAPDSAPESQINIINHVDNSVEVVISTLPKGSKSIEQRLNEALGNEEVKEAERDDAEKLAQLIKVERRVVRSNHKIERLLKRYSVLRLSPQLDTDISLHGTRFDLWFEAASNQVHYQLAGDEPGYDRGGYPLTRWMNEVRLAVIGKMLE